MKRASKQDEIISLAQNFLKGKNVNDQPLKVLKTGGFYPSKFVGRWYLFLCRSASLRRRIFLAQAEQYFARLDFGVKLAPHSQHSFR